MPQRVFLSSVTNELGEVRDAVRSVLNKWQKHGLQTTVQSDFGTGGNTLLEKLDDYILECDAVLFLIGDTSGAFATKNEFQKLIARYPSLEDDIPQIGELRAGGQELSYTQWEYWLSTFHNKKRLVYVDERQDRSQTGVSATEIDSQRRFRVAVEEVGKDRSTFTSSESLCARIGPDLLEAIGLPDAPMPLWKKLAVAAVAIIVFGVGGFALNQPDPPPIEIPPDIPLMPEHHPALSVQTKDVSTEHVFVFVDPKEAQWSKHMSQSMEAFYLSTREVSEEQFAAFVDDRHPGELTSIVGERSNKPVVNVSRQLADEYCKWLTERFGGRLEFHLPHEDEWRLATAPILHSSENLQEYVTSNSLELAECGSRRPTAAGFYDLLGNANEWCAEGSAIGGDDSDPETVYPKNEITRTIRSRTGFRIAAKGVRTESLTIKNESDDTIELRIWELLTEETIFAPVVEAGNDGICEEFIHGGWVFVANRSNRSTDLDPIGCAYVGSLKTATLIISNTSSGLAVRCEEFGSASCDNSLGEEH